MKQTILAGLGLILLLGGSASAVWLAAGPAEGKASHGRFTGEVKPVLYVTEVEASAEFFRDVLGFDLVSFAGEEEAPYYAEMAAGEQRFGLHEPQNAADAARVGRQKLYFRVEDLAAHRKRVTAWGGEPGPVQETAWMDLFTVVDPDGHEIVFAVTDPEIHTVNPW